MKKVVIAAQERIDDFERTAIEFFRAVLGMDYGKCIVTDEIRLSDFASCGLPEDIADTTQSLQALHSAWDAWVVPGSTPGRATVEARLANSKFVVEIVAIAAM